MINELELRAFAKINLALDVLRRRPDGYHDVRMVMQNVRIFDKISMEKCGEEKLTLETNLRYLPVDDNNLMIRAARMMKEKYDLPGGIKMKLEKHIPVAAGMAGGSTDAAAVIFGINRMYDLYLSLPEMQEIGVKLGADIPYCLMRRTALAEGIGEILTPLPSCPDCHVVVAKPAISVSTKYVYENLVLDENTKHPDIDGMVEALKARDLQSVASHMGNVLESVTEKAYPEITSIKDYMKEHGALNAMMSGSGPTVFGLFTGLDEARECSDGLYKKGIARFVRTVGMFV